MIKLSLRLFYNRRNISFLLLFIAGMTALTMVSFQESEFRTNLISSLFGLSISIFYLFIATSSSVLLSTGFVSKLLSSGMKRREYFQSRLVQLILAAIIFHSITLLCAKLLTERYPILHNDFGFFLVSPFFSYLLAGLVSLLISHYVNGIVVTVILVYLIPQIDRIIYLLHYVFGKEPLIYFLPNQLVFELSNSETNAFGFKFLSVLFFIIGFALLLKNRIHRMDFK